MVYVETHVVTPVCKWYTLQTNSWHIHILNIVYTLYAYIHVSYISYTHTYMYRENTRVKNKQVTWLDNNINEWTKFSFGFASMNSTHVYVLITTVHAHSHHMTEHVQHTLCVIYKGLTQILHHFRESWLFFWRSSVLASDLRESPLSLHIHPHLHLEALSSSDAYIFSSSTAFLPIPTYTYVFALQVHVRIFWG